MKEEEKKKRRLLLFQLQLFPKGVFGKTWWYPTWYPFGIFVRKNDEDGVRGGSIAATLVWFNLGRGVLELREGAD